MQKRNNASAILQSKIEAFMKNQAGSSISQKQIIAGLGMGQQDAGIIKNELNKMEEKGLLVRTEDGRFGLPEKMGILTGVLDRNRRGFAFLRPEQEREDVYISAKNLNEAAHGDRVLVKLDRRRSRKHREGTVIGILKRGQSRFVGTLHREGRRSYVIPDDRRFPGPVQVPPKETGQAKPGDKVIVEIQKWGRENKPSRGKMIKRIGSPGTPGTEQATFAYRFDLPGEFPQKALKELETLPGETEIAELARSQGRPEFDNMIMVTIDDEQARDFDDAVSLEKVNDSLYRLGVHIADVSEYVRRGKPLDREALKRGTSTYLVEKAIHMLPPELSEKLCSLQAGKDRFAVSVFMDIDREGNLVDSQFTPSLIRVTERLSYRQVESYLAGGRNKLPFKNEGVAEMIDRMSRLAGILRERRMQRGSLDLDIPEARIEVNEKGIPLSVEKREMGQAESLIEEFMIYCNETVAGYLDNKKLPCIYRVHAVPTGEKLNALRETLVLMNVGPVQNIRELKPKHLKMLLDKTRGEKTDRLVRYMILRSMPQACYSAENEGHFGLASPFYCHFTSPIRRYPDLVVHRILKQHLQPGGVSKQNIKRLQSRLPAIALQSSERERAAVEIERASIEIKKAQFMESKLGEVYTGIINGVTSFGIFVELDNTVEGMIPLTELKDDYYVHHEKAAALIGERTRKTYRMGDLIDVQVARVDREEGKIAFAPVKKEEG